MGFSPLTFVGFLILAGIGRVLMLLWLKAPYSKWLSRWKFFNEMFSCNLCLGTWVYFILALILRANLFESYLPVISEGMVGALASFVVWVFEAGWNSYFRNYVLQDEE